MEKFQWRGREGGNEKKTERRWGTDGRSTSDREGEEKRD